MKKSLLILFALFLTNACFADKTTVTQGSFGHGSACNGLGVCGVKTTQNPNSNITMYWLLSSDQTRLDLTISEDMMLETPEEIATNMRSGKFIMPEAFRFPSEVCRLLEVESITIPPGTYSVTHSYDGYTVHFTLE